MTATNNSANRLAGTKKQGPLTQFVIDHPCTTILLVALFIGYSVVSVTIRYLRKESMTAPDTVAMMGLSRRYYEEGKYDEAIQLNQTLERRKRNHWYSELTTGNALFKKGDYARAETHFRKATELNTNGPLPLLNLALTCFKQGKTEEAMAYYSAVTNRFRYEYPEISDRAAQALLLISQTSGPAP